MDNVLTVRGFIITTLCLELFYLEYDEFIKDIE